MKINQGTRIWLWICSMMLVCMVEGFKCDVDELSKYDFGKIKGEYSAKLSRKTPPSTTVTTWTLGICSTIKDVDECEGAELCGITKVQLDSNKYVTQVIKTAEDTKVSYKPYGNDKKKSDKSSKQGVVVKYDEFSWGDQTITAQVDLVCATKDDDEDDLDKLVLDNWDDKSLKLTMKTKSACLSKKNSSKPDKNKADNGETWGWFTWIFIFFVLFLSIYIIGGAWFQYNKGNSIDFQTALKEVIENFIDVIKGLPIFVKEIIEKFTGNSNRGEYSAV